MNRLATLTLLFVIALITVVAALPALAGLEAAKATLCNAPYVNGTWWQRFCVATVSSAQHMVFFIVFALVLALALAAALILHFISTCCAWGESRVHALRR